MKEYVAIGIGALAQLLFSSRLILQWLLSEKSKKVLTPLLFWELSLLASFLLFVYGYLRDDFAIMLGQSLTYYIYIRNIQLQGEWTKIPIALRLFIYVFPLAIVLYGFNNGRIDFDKLFKNDDIPAWLLALGIVSQVLFTLRFVYQWLYSENRKQSLLPMGFWLLSLIGSGSILTYAVLRRDPILFAGHLVGFLVYARNISILRKTNEKMA